MNIIDLPDYEVTTTVHESTDSIVFHAIRNADQQPVILKMLQKDYPTASELARYQREFEILSKLDSSSIVKVYQLGKYQNTLFLLIEDFGGESLTQLMKIPFEQGGLKGMPVTALLTLASKMAHAVGEIHAENIIHKDINPSNIVWNPATEQLKIIDLGIASYLPREHLSLRNPEQLEGTLAYLAPEQTGRINRAIDYRSDLYSLGVTFYELLTGQLPFTVSDAMALVHCHIAETAVPVWERNPDVPAIVSDIVMKLMAKNAEDRYQSAFGVKADLEQSLANDMQHFELAQNDFSGRFQIPQKLYGRDAEVNTLLQAFERVSHGGCEMMLVAGFSGVGKTALVREVYKPMTEKRGYFAAGKFDQFQRNIPYSGLFQALDALCDYLLTENTERINAWRKLILQAVGDNGQVLTDVIPKLELIIGNQPAVPEVSASDAKNRFNLVFQYFFKAISRPEHPFILFLDDLQWADNPSLELLKTLMADMETRYFLIIGAYRENEVDEGHPLTVLSRHLYQTHAAISTVQLPNLLFSDANRLIADTLMATLDFSQPLTQLVYEKTQGNAFFIHEFLKSLYQKGLLAFAVRNQQWQWDVAQIAALNMTGNVTELMVNKIHKLSPRTQVVLKLAACIGNRFDLKMLALLYQHSLHDTLDYLWQAIEEGLVNPLDDNYKQLNNQANDDVNSLFSFQHDRVQQAAYSLIEDADKPILHYQIGQLLWIDNINLEDRLFEIADHINAGICLVEHQTEKNQIAQLNLQAGQKAKSAVAYDAAQRYFQTGIELLPADCWQHHYALTLSLYEGAATTAALHGDWTQMEQWSAILFQHAQTVLDTVKTYETKIQTYCGQNKLLEAVKTGLQVLRQLGCVLPEAPTMADIQQGFTDTMALLPQSNLQQLTQLPTMTDATALATMRIIISMVPATFQTVPTLFPLLGYQEVKLSVQYGNTAYSACGYGDLGVILVGIFHDIERGYQFGQIALELVKQTEAKETKAATLFKIAAFTLYGKHHIADTFPLFQEIYQAGIEFGNLESAAYSASFQGLYRYFAGIKLEEVEQVFAINAKRLRQIKQDNQSMLNQIFHQVVLNLRGEADCPWVLTGSVADEAQLFALQTAANNLIALSLLSLGKLILAYLFKQTETALDSAEQTKQYLSGANGFLQEPLFYFYDSLTQLARDNSTVSAAAQQQILHRVAENQTTLQQWLPHAAMNFQHKFDLVAAEQARVMGKTVEAMDKYEQAISGAENHAYLQDAALAYELAAEFYFGRGMDKVARLYFKEAHYRYQQWGATAKLKQLEQDYPHLLASQTLFHLSAEKTRNTKSTTVATPMSGTDTSNLLDLSTVMKAAQTISSEIVLDKLLEKMLRIVIENAGARRGLLILPQDEQWLIEAKVEIDPINVAVLGHVPLETVGGHSQTPELPVSIANYVIRTQKSVVLSDAVHEGQFSQSAYLAKQQPKSILCMPLINQGRLSGILYLENNLIPGAFTPERLEVISLLSSQIAVSIENAVLYDDLEQKVAARTLELGKALTALWSEMELAKQIQTCLLPTKPFIADYDIVASCEPFDEIGGDYYDVISVSGYDWIVMGDVSGHGVTSGLVMMMVQTAIHTVITNNPASTPSDVLSAINRIIYDNIIRMDESKHMTIVLLAGGENGQFSFAGLHEDILLFRAATGKVEQLETNGFWIGIEPDISHMLSTDTLTLNSGDAMILFTDGVTEAKNEHGFFGNERLLTCIETVGHKDATAIHSTILEALQGYKKSDDVTLMVMKRR